MTELKINGGDYVADGVGGTVRVKGRDALLQRVLFRLTARRGRFPFLEDLGSTLYALGGEAPSHRQSAAEAAVAQALAEEKNLRVEQVGLEGEHLTVRINYEGEELNLQLTVR
ncbi:MULTISPECIES: hypothetical protein [unclassified Oscillibacter]|uniref:hypothetical protein n=1 Tax=unclassified Oscillibacter TaxID=2629304 RepID=UPI0025DFD009|nr:MULTISPECIES: hypothetical protein [unclassified Oscillibacter]